MTTQNVIVGTYSGDAKLGFTSGGKVVAYRPKYEDEMEGLDNWVLQDCQAEVSTYFFADARYRYRLVQSDSGRAVTYDPSNGEFKMTENTLTDLPQQLFRFVGGTTLAFRHDGKEKVVHSYKISNYKFALIDEDNNTGFTGTTISMNGSNVRAWNVAPVVPLPSGYALANSCDAPVDPYPYYPANVNYYYNISDCRGFLQNGYTPDRLGQFCETRLCSVVHDTRCFAKNEDCLLSMGNAYKRDASGVCKRTNCTIDNVQCFGIYSDCVNAADGPPTHWAHIDGSCKQSDCATVDIAKGCFAHLEDCTSYVSADSVFLLQADDTCIRSETLCDPAVDMRKCFDSAEKCTAAQTGPYCYIPALGCAPKLPGDADCFDDQAACLARKTGYSVINNKCERVYCNYTDPKETNCFSTEAACNAVVCIYENDSCATTDGRKCCTGLKCYDAKCQDETCKEVNAECSTSAADCCNGLQCNKHNVCKKEGENNGMPSWALWLIIAAVIVLLAVFGVVALKMSKIGKRKERHETEEDETRGKSADAEP